jgi:hypothetical protein
MANPTAAPRVVTFRVQVDAVAGGADDTVELGLAPFDGTVTRAEVISEGITGANTNTRKHEVINKGQAGAGTTVVATKQYNSGVNAAASDNTAVTLSATAADLLVAAGDALAFVSTHVGTGIADTGGIVEVDVTSR